MTLPDPLPQVAFDTGVICGAILHHQAMLHKHRSTLYTHLTLTYVVGMTGIDAIRLFDTHLYTSNPIPP